MLHNTHLVSFVYHYDDVVVSKVVYTRINNLYSSFCKVSLHRDLFTRVDVRIVSLGERFLQLLQLAACKRRPDATLFALLWTDRRRVDVIRSLVVVHLVRQSSCCCSHDKIQSYFNEN